MKKLPIDTDLEQYEKDVNAISQYRLVDDFVINDGKVHPFAIVVPGGSYFKVCSFIEGIPIAKKLNEKGISAFIIYYRIKDEATFPAPMDDLARAVREIFSESNKYRLDTSNYSIWGSSAGGHLSASFGTDNMGYIKYKLPKPTVIVLSYPVITMDKSLTHKFSHDLLIGENATKEKEDFTSIEKHVTKDYPPTYIWCGDSDTTVNPENTKMMAAALQKVGVPFKMEIFQNVVHGVGPASGTTAEGWIDKAINFWMDQTK